MNAEQFKNLRQLISARRVAALGTLHDGKPLVTMTPFAVSRGTGQEGFLIHVSQLAAHTRDMMQSADVSFMIMASEGSADSVLATRRVTIACMAYRVERESAEWENLTRTYLDAIPDALPLFGFGDFHFFLLNPQSARFVAGFAQAFNLSREQILEVIRAEG